MKKCIICGREFESKDGRHITCGRAACQRERHRASDRKYYKEHYTKGAGQGAAARLSPETLAWLAERDRQYEARFGKCDGAVRGRIPYGGGTKGVNKWSNTD